MSRYEPQTFVELAQHIEQTLGHHQVFHCRTAKGQQAKAVDLVSLELKEVHFLNQGTSGVYMQFHAVFDSAGQLVVASPDFILLGHLRVYGVVLGAQTVQAETGYTARTLTCEVSRAQLCGPMREEMEKFRKKTVEKMAASAVKAERLTETYKAAVTELKQIESTIRGFKKRHIRLQSKPPARVKGTKEAAALKQFESAIRVLQNDHARIQRRLLARDAAAHKKGTPPFQVVIG